MNSIAESLRGHLLTGDLLLSSVIKHFLSCLGADDIWEPSSEEETPRTMVAIFDYNPAESSPNADTEAELTFCAGDLVTILGSMDDDGFYYAEIRGQKGLVPSNFLEAVASEDVGPPDESSLGRQHVRKRRVQ
ncbi:RIMS-binding protein 2-like [Pogona vitticeps]